MITQPAQRVQLDSGANRSIGTAYVIWLFLGIIGGHYFYLRKPGMGLLYLFTFGLFMFGWLIDGIRLPAMVRQVNAIGF